MRTTTLLITVAVLSVAVAGSAVAQAEPDLAAQRAQIRGERDAIVKSNLPLTPEQSAAFWPLYKEYRGETQKVGDRMEKLIRDYASGYNTTLTDEHATALFKEFLAIQKETVRLREQYATRFGAVLPPKSLLRFYQLENKLDTRVAKDLVDQVPLAK